VTVPPPPRQTPSPPLRAHRRSPDGSAQEETLSRRRRMLNAISPWAISLVLVVATWGLTQVEKDEDARYEPFVTRAGIGERAETRNLTVTVTDVHAARAVTDGTRWRAEGTWLVVDLDAAATREQAGTALRVTNLRIAGRTYSATERASSLLQVPLVTGVPQHGSVAFELPKEALKGNGTLVFAEVYDYSADGIIEVPLDLEAEVQLDETGWAQ